MSISDKTISSNSISVDHDGKTVSSAKEICRYFSSGKPCFKGRYCKFRHITPQLLPQAQEISSDITSNFSNISNNEAINHNQFLRSSDHKSYRKKQLINQHDFTETSSLSNKKQPNRGSSGFLKKHSICKYFLQQNGCRYGSRCSNIHDISGSSNSKFNSTRKRNYKHYESFKKRNSHSKQLSFLENNEELYYTTPMKPCESKANVEHTAADNAGSPGCLETHSSQEIQSDVNSEINISSLHIKNVKENVPKASPAMHVKQQSSKQTTKSNSPFLHEICALDQEKCQQLRSSDIKALLTRFSSAEVVLSRGVNGQLKGEQYRFIFSPSTPDWPYDVRSVGMACWFSTFYPLKRLKIQVTNDVELPQTLSSLIEEKIDNWLKERFIKNSSSKMTEIVFRVFIKWIDKNLMDFFTLGLKKYQKELMAEAAGFEFIPASVLQKEATLTLPRLDQDSSDDEASDDAEFSCSDSKSCGTSCDETDENTIDKSSKCLNDLSTEIENLDLQDVSEMTEKAENIENLGPNNAFSESEKNPRRGTEVRLNGLMLAENSSTLVPLKFPFIANCSRCRFQNEVKVTVKTVFSLSCTKCANSMSIIFRPEIAHQYSHVIGYLDLEGCVAFDLVLSEMDFKLGCMNCSKENSIHGFPPGPPKDTWCRYCHVKLRICTGGTKFINLQTDGLNDSGFNRVTIESKRAKKMLKDPLIQLGQPLPKEGTCKHYKKSYRWFRFPCCGKTYPCDICHDDDNTDHEMKLANRVICGFCAKEQPFVPDKHCDGCGNHMTKRNSAHWEGGRGCRNQITMSRGDNKKYSNMNKTVSKSVEQKNKLLKKKTKLRHA